MQINEPLLNHLLKLFFTVNFNEYREDIKIHRLLQTLTLLNIAIIKTMVLIEHPM